MAGAPDPRLVRFGQVVRKARRDRNLSQEALGARAGVARSHVGHVEHATKDVQLTTMFRLLEGLEMTPLEFFADFEGDGEAGGAEQQPERTRS